MRDAHKRLLGAIAIVCLLAVGNEQVDAQHAASGSESLSNDWVGLDGFGVAVDQRERALVVHAGGAVRLTIPADWHVNEVGFKRQVRLLVSPHALKPTARDVMDGLWLALEYYPNGLERESDEALRQRVVGSLQSIHGGNSDSAEGRVVQLNGLMAARTDFKLDTRKASGKENEEAAGETGISPERDNVLNSRGFHMILQTDWCRCQMHALAPSHVADQRLLEFERILDDLRLAEPSSEHHGMVPSVVDATSILGSWKAHASRFRLRGDGTIDIETDAPFRFTTKQGGQHYAGTKLLGRFRARDDLLFIEWDDDSKLNYRWRLRGNKLLMTDHEGRMTQLVRISE
jgi:hypothetical protein